MSLTIPDAFEKEVEATLRTTDERTYRRFADGGFDAGVEQFIRQSRASEVRDFVVSGNRCVECGKTTPVMHYVGVHDERMTLCNDCCPARLKAVPQDVVDILEKP